MNENIITERNAMVDRIITAYRAQIYDWSFADFLKLINNNKKLWSTVLGAMLVIMGLLIWGFVCQRFWVVMAALLLEAIAVIRADRFAVKQHRRALENRCEHLTDVTSFIKTVIPGSDLFNPDQISELIDRLTGIVDEKRPFVRFSRSIKSFANTIVFPIITFVAGVCSGYLQQMDVSVVLVCGIGAIFTIAMIWFLTSMLFDFVRPILCRDFDAAVSLREDLMDLRLLHFAAKSN